MTGYKLAHYGADTSWDECKESILERRQLANEPIGYPVELGDHIDIWNARDTTYTDPNDPVRGFVWRGQQAPPDRRLDAQNYKLSAPL